MLARAPSRTPLSSTYKEKMHSTIPPRYCIFLFHCSPAPLSIPSTPSIHRGLRHTVMITARRWHYFNTHATLDTPNPSILEYWRRYSTWIVFGRNEKREWGEKIFLGNVACEEILFSRRRKRILKSWKKLLETISFDSFIYSDDILMVFLGFGWQKEGGKILKEKNSAEDSFLVTNTSSKNS